MPNTQHTWCHSRSKSGQRADRDFVQLAFQEGIHALESNCTIEKLEEAQSFYEKQAVGVLFQEPSEVTLSETPVRTLGDGKVLDIRWPSQYQALHPDYKRALEEYPESQECHARWFRHSTPSPTLIYLHGWGAGEFSLEEKTFPVRWLHRRGLDVLMFTLPFHARRARTGATNPSILSGDPVQANEGFAQAIHDLRCLILTLKRRGAPLIGATGVSLGGFLCALLATVEPELDFIVPVVPFASFPELLWHHSKNTPMQDSILSKGITFERFSKAFNATSPLHRASLLPGDRILIGAAENDQVTPPEQALALQEHFAGSSTVMFPGAHFSQLARARFFRKMGKFLENIQVISPAKRNKTSLSFSQPPRQNPTEQRAQTSQ